MTHKPAIIWFTGLSGAGKSSTANALNHTLLEHGKQTFLLDGDTVRTGLCSDLSFSHEDRSENIRRIGELAKLFADTGFVVLVACISPFHKDRAQARERNHKHPFIEVYMETPLTVCEQRDVKGLYKKARNGELENFSGIDSPYESPKHPEIRLNSSTSSLEQSVATITRYLTTKGILA